ncbi:MAG: hypothetical protein COU29_02655 [Candidatus Magasanikbacteria bacterium CG10_big_fil_rev_8_21_14_0_10_36_32]|uniref:Nucleotidyl transferase domain-containing protein n=1 Tax=Candidatus Magasanikbacteria bacterium CG10_big_fil_rev_8_21_14_0_10_36_32 TaxID=1974646 RepID=A0A2M6W791_9BACT|nr:MAG: hypothetical protein COU29_02655 [Candidatus Magasanikbacteria bacterium CG10_big_fil_rev_8_21_14_0_10_36_32]
MLINFNKIGVVILAGGRGARLKCANTPKAMLELSGRPIVSYLIETLKKINFNSDRICVVVGKNRDKIMNYFGDTVTYAIQDIPKGTAHAAYVGAMALPPEVEQVLIINGDDGAFYTEQTLQNFIEQHINYGATVSLLSVIPDKFELYGRITKDEKGRIIIIEKESLNEDQKKIRETSSGTFCLDKNWFVKIFPDMPPMKKLGEYGLPTVLEMANEQNLSVQVIKLQDSSQWFGINTPEELEEARRRKANKKNY